jgi:hypothetical protein
MWALSDSTRRKLESIADRRVMKAMLKLPRAGVYGQVDRADRVGMRLTLSKLVR